MIVETVVVVECDHPGCEAQVKLPIGASGQDRTVMGSLKARGWQPFGMSDYCPEHRKSE